MSDPIARARDDLARLEQKIAFHDAERETAAKAAEEVRTFIRLFHSYSVGSPSHNKRGSPKATPAGGQTKSERISEIAAELIRNSNRRAAISEISSLSRGWRGVDRQCY